MDIGRFEMEHNSGQVGDGKRQREMREHALTMLGICIQLDNLSLETMNHVGEAKTSFSVEHNKITKIIVCSSACGNCTNHPNVDKNMLNLSPI